MGNANSSLCRWTVTTFMDKISYSCYSEDKNGKPYEEGLCRQELLSVCVLKIKNRIRREICPLYLLNIHKYV